MTEKLTTHDRPPQFSIAAILGAMVVIGVALAVFRISISGGCTFAIVVLPALGRAYWAEMLGRRAGVHGKHGDAVGTYFVSLMIVLLIAAGSWAVAGVAFVAAWLAADWTSPAHGPFVLASLVFCTVFLGLFWLARPRAPHYLP